MRSKPGVGLALGFIALCFGTMAAADPLAGRPLGTFRLTYYLVAQEQAAAGRGDVPVFGPDCRRVIARLIAWLLDTELFRIPVAIEPATYGYAALLTLAATSVSAALVRRRIDRLDLIRVLKTRE